MRKRTVFHLCPTHKPYGGGRRTAEMFCEGGPGNGQPCDGDYCSILPGSDFFSTDTTDATAATWAPNWSVNMQAALNS